MPRLLTDEAVLPGLIFGLHFDGRGRALLLETGADLPPLDAAAGFVWLHVDLVDARLHGSVEAGRLGPPRLAAAIFARDGHQRVVVDGAAVGLVVADRERDFAGVLSDEPTCRLHCVLGQGYLVSGRRHATACAEAARDAALAGLTVTSPARLLELFVGHVVQAMEAGAVRMSEELDAIEDRILDGAGADDTGPLAPIRRRAVRLRRQVAGLGAVFHRLEAETDDDGDALPEAVMTMAARVVQRIDSLDRDMGVLAERSRLLQDEIAGRTAAQTNRQLFTLSILTSLFLPPTLVTGVFGMNSKGLFLADFENGSTIALGIGALSSLAVFLVIRRLGVAGRRG